MLLSSTTQRSFYPKIYWFPTSLVFFPIECVIPGEKIKSKETILKSLQSCHVSLAFSKSVGVLNMESLQLQLNFKMLNQCFSILILPETFTVTCYFLCQKSNVFHTAKWRTKCVDFKLKRNCSIWHFEILFCVHETAEYGLHKHNTTFARR